VGAGAPSFWGGVALGGTARGGTARGDPDSVGGVLPGLVPGATKTGRWVGGIGGVGVRVIGDVPGRHITRHVVS
jgi:hypothetical protein